MSFLVFKYAISAESKFLVTITVVLTCCSAGDNVVEGVSSLGKSGNVSSSNLCE